MRLRFPPLRLPLTAGALALILLGVSRPVHADSDTHKDTDNFREDVFRCEEAIAHLEECCPRFTTPVACKHYEYTSERSGCESSDRYGSSTDPGLNLDESKCIQALSCQELVSRGVCSRVAAATDRSEDYEHHDGYDNKGPEHDDRVDHAAVCP